MKVLGFFLGIVACIAASADASTDTYEPHQQAFACSVGGCNVSCPTTGRSPAIQFKAGALKLTLLPSRVAVFEATSGLGSRKTYLVDLSERNCEIAQ
jgi:hypothetical protein